MKKTKIIKLILVSGIAVSCSTHETPETKLYNRLYVRTDTEGVYTHGEPYYDLYPYGQVQDNYYGGGGAMYNHYGYGSAMISDRSSAEISHISRGGFGSSAFHVSA